MGDCVGPLVGELLAGDSNITVYGNINEQITALNIARLAEKIKVSHPDDIVIAVDSALGAIDNIGKIKLVNNGIQPGGAFSSLHNRVGDIGIMAIVGQSSGDRLAELSTRSFAFIFTLAQKIASLLREVVKEVV